MPRQWRWILAGLVAAATLIVAVTRPGEPQAAAAPDASAVPVAGPADIRHLEPAPDSVGGQPARFAWSAAAGADSYTLRVWNESDIRVVSESGLTTTSIDFPKEYDMPAGTYFWAVVGMRGDQPVAESGLAAFVVQRP